MHTTLIVYRYVFSAAQRISAACLSVYPSVDPTHRRTADILMYYYRYIIYLLKNPLNNHSTSISNNSVIHSSYVFSGNDSVCKLRRQYHCEKSCGIKQFKTCDIQCAECVIFVVCFFPFLVYSVCLSVSLPLLLSLFCFYIVNRFFDKIKFALRSAFFSSVMGLRLLLFILAETINLRQRSAPHPGQHASRS